MKKLVSLAIVAVSLFASDGYELIKQNGCLSCHAIASRKAAPAFAGIAFRNTRFEGANAKNVIMNTIKNGSSGKYPRFSDSAMPPYKNLSDEELSKIADFILAQKSKHTMMYRGGGCGGCGRCGMR